VHKSHIMTNIPAEGAAARPRYQFRDLTVKITTSVGRNLSRVRCKAVKKNQSGGSSLDWTAYTESTDTEGVIAILGDTSHPEWQYTINEVANRAMRAMVTEDEKLGVAARKELAEIMDFLEKTELKDTTRFFEVLQLMTKHMIPPKDDLKLEGQYLAAIEKIFGVIEDSGWELEPYDYM